MGQEGLVPAERLDDRAGVAQDREDAGRGRLILCVFGDQPKVLEARIKEADNRVAEMGRRIDELNQATRDGLRRAREEYQGAIDRVKTAPERDGMRAMLSQAAAEGAVTADGVRVRLPGSALRLRWTATANELRLQIEAVDGTVHRSLLWPEGLPTDRLGLDLAAALRSVGAYPGDDDFDMSRLIRGCIDVVELGDRRRARSLTRFGGVLEITNAQWAIGASGIFRIDNVAHGIHAQDILAGQDLRLSVAAKPQADLALFTECQQVALEYFRAQV